MNLFDIHKDMFLQKFAEQWGGGEFPEPPWIRQWLSVNLFLKISTVYSTLRHNIISFKLSRLYCGSLCVCNRSF
jgi:hypothetical protein